MNKPPGRMRRLNLVLPEDVIRALKGRAGLEGVNPRDLITAWVRSWATPETRRPGGRP
jgi:hypothetical protein